MRCRIFGLGKKWILVLGVVVGVSGGGVGGVLEFEKNGNKID